MLSEIEARKGMFVAARNRGTSPTTASNADQPLATHGLPHLAGGTPLSASACLAAAVLCSRTMATTWSSRKVPSDVVLSMYTPSTSQLPLRLRCRQGHRGVGAQGMRKQAGGRGRTQVVRGAGCGTRIRERCRGGREAAVGGEGTAPAAH